MKVVVVGSGGREHGLALALRRFDHEVVVTPGNPGIGGSTGTPVEELVYAGDVDLVIIGSENDLVGGLADRLREQDVAVLGPGAEGAQIEGSKAYMKQLAVEAGLPTAEYQVFQMGDRDAALHYAAERLATDGSVVIKTSYLKGGKGVSVLNDIVSAAADIEAKLVDGSIIIEQCLTGPEVSVFAICDGVDSVCLPAAQDYKRQLDGDEGPNTGGMGAWSPLPFLPSDFLERVNEQFFQPTLAELCERGIDYRGVLYAGFILTSDGPKLLEYNVRFGDPDSQVVLLRATSDLGELFLAAALGDLNRVAPPTFSDDTAVLVVAAAEGYPENPIKGDLIQGLFSASRVEGATVLYAGVRENQSRQTFVGGGRVLNIIGRGANRGAARRAAYDSIDCVRWPGMQYRKDIAVNPDQ